MSQESMILTYMRKHGVITPLIAVRRLNCLSLSQRVGELERDGHLFSKIWIQKGRKRYRGYSLVESVREAA